MASPDVTAVFDEATSTVTYVVADPATVVCIVIDSVLDYDPVAEQRAKNIHIHDGFPGARQ